MIEHKKSVRKIPAELFFIREIMTQTVYLQIDVSPPGYFIHKMYCDVNAFILPKDHSVGFMLFLVLLRILGTMFQQLWHSTNIGLLHHDTRYVIPFKYCQINCNYL